MRFLITNIEIITLIACAKMVAIAAPTAPMWKTATSNKSPRIFNTQAIVTVRSGIFESPIPLNILPTKLYATINNIPAEQIATYHTVLSKASAGARINFVRAEEAKTITTVTIKEITAKRLIPVPMISPASSRLPAPIFSPT